VNQEPSLPSRIRRKVRSRALPRELSQYDPLPTRHDPRIRTRRRQRQSLGRLTAACESRLDIDVARERHVHVLQQKLNGVNEALLTNLHGMLAE
jgi:hypothetical protein